MRRVLIQDISFIGLISLLLVISILSYYQVNRLNKVSTQVSHTTYVKIKLEQVLSALSAAQVSNREYLLTRDSAFMEPYHATFRDVSSRLREIDSLVPGNTDQQKHLNALRLLVYRKFDRLDYAIKHACDEHLDLTPFLLEDKQNMDSVRSGIQAMIGTENAMLTARTREKDHLAFLTPVYSLLLSLFAIISVGLVYLRLRNETGLRVEAESAEARIQDFFMQVPAMVAILKGPEHTFEFANPMYRELIGNQDPIGRNFRDVLPETERQGHGILLDNVLRTGTSFIGMEMPFTVERNGIRVQRYINFIYQAFSDRKNYPEGIMAFCYDVSDLVLARKKIEETVAQRTSELRSANEALLGTNAELEQFASVTSHDLQEPLRKIGLFANILLEKDDHRNPQYSDYLRRIEFAAKRMTGLIRDLLSFSHLQDRNHDFVPVDLKAILDSVLEDFDLLIEEKQARFDIGPLPVIEALPLQINQLFYNLVSNALKFTQKEVPPLISIRAESITAEEYDQYRLDISRRYVRILFSDNGIGFDPAFAGKIFEIFQRLHAKTDFMGNGIGLAICKKIVTNHQGQIIPHSREGSGATFELILPVAQAPA